ncbi:hypothetical protein GCM10010486_89370 [Nonomuraea roseoviolacea subsp. carminata]
MWFSGKPLSSISYPPQRGDPLGGGFVLLGQPKVHPAMNQSVRRLLWGLAGAATALITYIAVAFVLFLLTFSLYALPILLIYTPLAFLAIGVLGVIRSIRLTRPQSSTPLSFWSGWALCPAGYLVLLLTS